MHSVIGNSQKAALVSSGNLFVTLEGTPGALTALQSLEALPEALECRQGSGSALKRDKQVS